MTEDVPIKELEGSEPSPTFGERLRVAFVTFVRALFRLIVLVIVFGLIVWGILYGLPALYQYYVYPIQNSITQLEQEQIQQEQNNAQLMLRLDEMQQRLSDLDIQNDTNKQSLDGLQSQLDTAQSTQEAYYGALESAQGATSNLRAEIDTSIAELNTMLDAIDATLNETSSEIEELSDQIATVENHLEDEESPVAALQRELQLVKAMELLTRSRLFIVENNLGLAQGDVLAARSIIVGIQVPSHQVEARAAIVERLDLGLSNLPEKPVLAAEDLEIAWQLLKNGLPGDVAIPSSTDMLPVEGTITPISTPSITPTGELETTSTPTPTATP